MISKFRDPVSGLIHLFSALLALVGLVLLLVLTNGQGLKQLSMGIYGVSLVTLFTASAVYHLAYPAESALLKLRKFDHSAIYVLIAGTYTPILINFFSGFLRWGFLALIWGIALAGVIVKLFVINAPRWVTAGVYLVMGWMAVLIVKPMLQSMPPAALWWMLAGGLTYSIGAVIYITKKLDLWPGIFGFHEVWHVFVSLAALCHFVMIFRYIALP
ncbi:MAG TPA: hemolysin [Anaerolineaceae bacterium]|nr:hemolysin [Anaerolineaceae bacterium]